MTSVFTHPNSVDAAAVQHWVTETLLTVAFDSEHQCNGVSAPTHHAAPQHELPDGQLHARQLAAGTPCDGDEPNRGCSVGPFPALEEALCTQYNSTILRCRRDKLNAMAPHLHYYLTRSICVDGHTHSSNHTVCTVDIRTYIAQLKCLAPACRNKPASTWRFPRSLLLQTDARTEWHEWLLHNRRFSTM
jgi:hypothetical protein